jgi:hypothetical protein
MAARNASRSRPARAYASARHRSNISMTSSVTSARHCARKATRIGYRRAAGARWRAWALDLRARCAKNLRRFGLRASRGQCSTPAARRNASFSRLPRMARGELEIAGRRSQASGVMPRVGSDSRRVSRRCWQSSVRNGPSRRNVSACADWRVSATSRSSWVTPGRTSRSRWSCSQARA